jgi:hypothetical protein
LRIADLVVGRCLVGVKAAFDPIASIGDWLNQVLAYALLDWSDALGVDTVAVYLGWQALLVSDSLARVPAARMTSLEVRSPGQAAELCERRSRSVAGESA